jgi:hypothetical protein
MVFLIIVLLIEPRGLQGFYESYQRRKSKPTPKEPENKEAEK